MIPHLNGVGIVWQDTSSGSILSSAWSGMIRFAEHRRTTFQDVKLLLRVTEWRRIPSRVDDASSSFGRTSWTNRSIVTSHRPSRPEILDLLRSNAIRAD